MSTSIQKDYEQRLQTFVGWPSNSCQLPEQLAAAGFIYEGRDDRVRCNKCKVRLYDWIPGNPLTRHGKFSKYKCEVYKKIKLSNQYSNNCDEPQANAMPNNTDVSKELAVNLETSAKYSTECQDFEPSDGSSFKGHHTVVTAPDDKSSEAGSPPGGRGNTRSWPIGLDAALLDWPGIQLLLKHGVDKEKMRRVIRARLDAGRGVIDDLPGLTKEVLR